MNLEKIHESKSKNVDYWEKVLEAPTPVYQELFNAEQAYLVENIKPDAVVLDVGCGDGRNTRNILKISNNVTGIDIDSKAIEDARKNFTGNPKVKLVQADATKLPFEEESFDAVIFLMILPNLDQGKAQALREASRVLKKSGFLIMSAFSENAFEERMKIYKKLGAPIKKIEGTKVIFDESLGANISEQFSRGELENLGSEAGLVMIECHKVGSIAYICKFNKK